MPIVVAILGIIIVVMGAVLLFMPSEQDNVAAAPVVETVKKTGNLEKAEEAVAIPETPSTSEASADTATATLTAEGNYLTPARTPYKVTVQLTMTADVITDVNVLYNDKETYSDPNQERFDNAYKPLVVGKKISELSLSRVGGASLTTDAFNEAVAKIAAEQA